MNRARRFDNKATLDVCKVLLAVFTAVLAGMTTAERPGWLQEAIMLDRREHPRSGPGADRHRWFAAKLFVAIVATIVAAYVTAKLL